MTEPKNTKAQKDFEITCLFCPESFPGMWDKNEDGSYKDSKVHTWFNFYCAGMQVAYRSVISSGDAMGKLKTLRGENGE